MPDRAKSTPTMKVSCEGLSAGFDIAGPFEGTAMKSGLVTSLKSFFIISPYYQVQHGGVGGDKI